MGNRDLDAALGVVARVFFVDQVHDRICFLPYRRIKLSLCCETLFEERSAGKPHATFYGSRRRATASGNPVTCIVQSGAWRYRALSGASTFASNASIPACVNSSLPAEMRRAIDLSGAGYLVLTLDEDEIRITTREQMLKHVRDLVSPYKPEHELASEQLIQDRRKEAEHEGEELEGGRHSKPVHSSLR